MLKVDRVCVEFHTSRVSQAKDESNSAGRSSGGYANAHTKTSEMDSHLIDAKRETTVEAVIAVKC